MAPLRAPLGTVTVNFVGRAGGDLAGHLAKGHARDLREVHAVNGEFLARGPRCWAEPCHHRCFAPDVEPRITSGHLQLGDDAAPLLRQRRVTGGQHRCAALLEESRPWRRHCDGLVTRPHDGGARQASNGRRDGHLRPGGQPRIGQCGHRGEIAERGARQDLGGDRQAHGGGCARLLGPRDVHGLRRGVDRGRAGCSRRAGRHHERRRRLGLRTTVEAHGLAREDPRRRGAPGIGLGHGGRVAPGVGIRVGGGGDGGVGGVPIAEVPCIVHDGRRRGHRG